MGFSPTISRDLAQVRGTRPAGFATMGPSDHRVVRHECAVAGPSGNGKSTRTTGLLEVLAEAGYQFMVIDPEGDLLDARSAVGAGEPAQLPRSTGPRLLAVPRQNVVANLIGLPIEHRPAFFDGLLPACRS